MTIFRETQNHSQNQTQSVRVEKCEKGTTKNTYKTYSVNRILR